MKKLAKEPLLHFVLLGASLFAFDAFQRERTVEAGRGDIVVSGGLIESLAALFTKTWQRPPTAEELGGLVDDYVLEETLYREGLALGVDQDDTVIRRRVRQKMEFVLDDILELAEPAEAELEAWLSGRPESYARPARYTFRQVYLNPERRTDARAEAALVLAKLRASFGSSNGGDPRELGDASLLEHAFVDARADQVESTFGRAFADQLAELATEEWSGPVESAFGLHLVFVDAKTEGELPELAEVREAVQRDWSYAQREKESKRFYEDLLARYRVTIEWPHDDRAADGEAQR